MVSKTWHVRPLGDGEEGDSPIARACSKAKSGDILRIHPGSYMGKVVLEKPLILEGVTDDDGFPEIEWDDEGPCIEVRADGCELRNLSLHHSAWEVSGEWGAVEITRGRLLIDRCHISTDATHGIICSGRSSEVEVFDSHLEHIGGKGILFDHQSRGTVEKTSISNADASGIEVRNRSHPEIRRCKIYKCGQNGVWFTDEARGLVEKCRIYRNRYPNVAITHRADPLLISCRIYRSEQNGVWVTNEGRGKIEECQIYENQYPGVGVEQKADPQFVNCRIYKGEEDGVWVAFEGKGRFEGVRSKDTNTQRSPSTKVARRDSTIVASTGDSRMESMSLTRGEGFSIAVRSTRTRSPMSLFPKTAIPTSSAVGSTRVGRMGFGLLRRGGDSSRTVISQTAISRKWGSPRKVGLGW